MNPRLIFKYPKPYIRRAIGKLLNHYRVIRYSGNTVICDICGWNGQLFFDQKCPKCKSLPRTRLVAFSLHHFDLLNDFSKILHIAPNENEYHYIKTLKRPIQHYDRLNNRYVKHINIVQDLRQTNLESGFYDLIIAWHVLEHIPEDVKAITEVYRLLKEGGHFLVSVPIYPNENSTTFEDVNIPYKDFEKVHGHYDHCRSCGMDYYKRFESVGFTTELLEVKLLDLKVIETFGLRKDHIVWCFTKQAHVV